MPKRPRVCTFRYGVPRKRDQALRIGTTRLPPRGVPKARWGEYFDVWFPVVGPSKKLLTRRPFTFKQYEREIFGRAESRQAVQLLAHIAVRMPISLGCYCEDETHCHRTYLRRMIEEAAAGIAEKA